MYVSVFRIFTFLLHHYDLLSCECFTAAHVRRYLNNPVSRVQDPHK